jgi:hypothetical protein
MMVLMVPTSFLHDVRLVVGHGEANGLQRGGDERYVPALRSQDVVCAYVKRTLTSIRTKESTYCTVAGTC